MRLDYIMAEKGITSVELAKRIGISPVKTMFERYKNEQISTVDGVKIDFPDSWVHMRRSNTEPIVRIYTEARTEKEAQDLADRFRSEIEREL